MVLPVKIFEITEETNLGVLAQKLKNLREEEEYETEDGKTLNLVTEIIDLDLKQNSITGTFSKDFVYKRFYRREMIELPVTEEAPFWILSFEGRIFLVVLGPSVARGVKKLLTNYVANRLSKALFIGTRAIVEVKIPHLTLKELHESNPQATRLIWFDEVDIPGVEKLCLAGSDIADTELYHDYLKHGQIWYVVFEVQKQGFVVGITRNCVITLFSRINTEEFIDYIMGEILALIE